MQIDALNLRSLMNPTASQPGEATTSRSTAEIQDYVCQLERHGHSAGDLVLQEFARRLKKATHGSDIAVRQGGDEFLIILPEYPPEKVNLVLSRLTHVHVDLGNKQIPVFCSSGWTQYRANDTAEELIRRADGALYSHKGAHIV